MGMVTTVHGQGGRFQSVFALTLWANEEGSLPSYSPKQEARIDPRFHCHCSKKEELQWFPKRCVRNFILALWWNSSQKITLKFTWFHPYKHPHSYVSNLFCLVSPCAIGSSQFLFVFFFPPWERPLITVNFFRVSGEGTRHSVHLS